MIFNFAMLKKVTEVKRLEYLPNMNCYRALTLSPKDELYPVSMVIPEIEIHKLTVQFNKLVPLGNRLRALVVYLKTGTAHGTETLVIEIAMA